MSKLLELYDKRSQAVTAARAFLDARRTISDALSAEDDAAYRKMEADIAALTKEIDREGKLSAIENELRKPTSAPILNAPEKPAVVATGRASDEYRREFLNSLRGRPVSNVLSEGVDSEGGYLVPAEFERQLLKAIDEANVIRSIAKTISTNAPHNITLAASGTTAAWIGENAPIPDRTPTFAQKTLDAYKLTDLVKVSIELLQDNVFDLEGYLIEEFARALGAAEEEAFCVGTGTGQPAGMFTASGGATIGVTAGSAIALDNVLDLIYSLKSPYRRNAAFLMNDATVAALRKLKDGNGAYIWQPSAQAGQPDRLLGYPLHTSPYAPLAAAGTRPIAFGDFSAYWIADRMGRTVKRLAELYANNGQVGFLAMERVDGKVVVAEGLKLLAMGA